jgi:hypothetical protein
MDAQTPDLKPFYTQLQALLQIGIDMQADRDLLDGPAGEDRDLHLAKLRAAADHMREHQAEVKAIRAQLAPLRQASALARTLYAAAADLELVVSLSQKAHDFHRPLVEQHLASAAQGGGF